MFIDLRERKGEREGNIHVRETSVGSPPICTPTGQGTCNLSVQGMALQPSEPLGHRHSGIF